MATTAKYQLRADIDGKPQGVIRLADGALIPADPEDDDWREYEEWLEEGNEPLPAD